MKPLCKGKLLAAVLAVADVSSDGDGKVYLSLPGLSDKVLIADSEEISLGDAGDAHFPIVDSSLFSEELIAALPTEKELNSLFEKYIKLALDNADDVTIEKSELTVDGVTQKCRVLKINVTEKTVLKIAEALLTELQKDKKMEKILKRIEKALPDEVKSEWDGDTLVSRFRSELAEGIEEIKSEQSALTGKGDTLLVLTDYIEDHQVIGRELSVPNGRSIASLTAEKGGKYASRFSFSSGEGDVVIAGSGNVKKGKLTGNYTVTVTSSFDYDENGGDGSAVSMEILTFSLIDFDTEKMKAGTPCGTVRLGLRNLTKLTAMAPEALRALRSCSGAEIRQLRNKRRPCPAPFHRGNCPRRRDPQLQAGGRRFSLDSRRGAAQCGKRGGHKKIHRLHRSGGAEKQTFLASFAAIACGGSYGASLRRAGCRLLNGAETEPAWKSKSRISEKDTGKERS